MKKIRLSLDALEVHSFATETADGAPRGTVEGHVVSKDTCETNCDQYTCMCLMATFAYQTCRESEASCVETCVNTCDVLVCA